MLKQYDSSAISLFYCLIKKKKPYCPQYDYDALVWVVDSADRDKITESADKLAEVMGMDVLRNKLLFVVGTKQDLDGALPAPELVRRLKLGNYSSKWTFAVSSTTTVGLKEAVDRMGKEVRRYIRRKERAATGGGGGGDLARPVVKAPVPAAAKESDHDIIIAEDGDL